MQSTILILADNVDTLRPKPRAKLLKHAKEQEKDASPAMINLILKKKTFALSTYKGAVMKKLNRNNSIHNIVCDRAVHMKCANLQIGYYHVFTANRNNFSIAFT